MTCYEHHVHDEFCDGHRTREKFRALAATRAYRDGRLHGALIVVARKARVAWGCGDLTVMTQALLDLTAAELAAGVDLTTPTDEDLRR